MENVIFCKRFRQNLPQTFLYSCERYNMALYAQTGGFSFLSK